MSSQPSALPGAFSCSRRPTAPATSRRRPRSTGPTPPARRATRSWSARTATSRRRRRRREPDEQRVHVDRQAGEPDHVLLARHRDERQRLHAELGVLVPDEEVGKHQAEASDVRKRVIAALTPAVRGRSGSRRSRGRRGLRLLSAASCDGARPPRPSDHVTSRRLPRDETTLGASASTATAQHRAVKRSS